MSPEDTPNERNVALKTAEGLVGKAYKSALPENERVKSGQLDCSGLVRYSMMQNPTIEDPFNSSGSNGVTRIINSSRQVELKDIREGDLVVIKSGGNENGHVGFVKNIVRDESGNVTQYTMLHAEASWTNSTTGQSGGGTINEAVINVGSEKGYAKSTYNHRFYQWDTTDTTQQMPTNTQVSSTTGTPTQSATNQTPSMGDQYKSEIRAASKPKISSRLMDQRAPIVQDIGRILRRIGL
jgi:hypothetical protein